MDEFPECRPLALNKSDCFVPSSALLRDPRGERI